MVWSSACAALRSLSRSAASSFDCRWVAGGVGEASLSGLKEDGRLRTMLHAGQDRSTTLQPVQGEAGPSHLARSRLCLCLKLLFSGGHLRHSLLSLHR